jgi:hypothetical protein
MRATKTLVRMCAALVVLIGLVASAPAIAAEDEQRGQRVRERSARERDALANGTQLYEVTETVHFTGNGVATSRDAVAVLVGFAPLGSPLCPLKALVTNPAAQTCTVTGIGQDMVPLATGTGPVSGTFAVVVNAPGNNSVHVPDLPLMTGTFSGTNDLSMAVLHGVPLGRIIGSFQIDGTGQQVPFTGTFRLPFALDANGDASEPKDEAQDVFYLGDDGQLIRVRPHERALGFPAVRLELKF